MITKWSRRPGGQTGKKEICLWTGKTWSFNDWFDKSEVPKMLNIWQCMEPIEELACLKTFELHGNWLKVKWAQMYFDVWIILGSSKVHDQRSHLENFHVFTTYWKNCFMCWTQPYDSLSLVFVVKRILAWCYCVKNIWNWWILNRSQMLATHSYLWWWIQAGSPMIEIEFIYRLRIDRFCLKYNIVKVSWLTFNWT